MAIRPLRREMPKENLNTDIQVMKETIKNIKDSSLQTSVENTAAHLEIKTTLMTMNTKLDTVINNKAEKTDLQTLDSRFWYLVVGFLMLLAGIIATWLKK